MSASSVVPSLIYLDEEGTARVQGVNTSVKMIVLDYLAHGYSPTEIHFQYPYLSLAQIHAAFSYYYAHQAEIEAEIARDAQEETDYFSHHPATLTREVLRARLEHRS